MIKVNKLFILLSMFVPMIGCDTIPLMPEFDTSIPAQLNKTADTNFDIYMWDEPSAFFWWQEGQTKQSIEISINATWGEKKALRNKSYMPRTFLLIEAHNEYNEWVLNFWHEVFNNSPYKRIIILNKTNTTPPGTLIIIRTRFLQLGILGKQAKFISNKSRLVGRVIYK